MALGFSSFDIKQIGDLVTEDRFGWVPIRVFLTDPATDSHPWVEIQVPIQYDRDARISDIRKMAFDKARAVLTETLALFDAHGLEGLQARSDETDAAEQRERMALLSLGIPTQRAS